MKLEQRDLEYFAVVAEHGNLGRAAEALALTQPALSMSLRRLERATGSKVVRRTAKGIELTDAGATLLKHVSRLRLAHEDVLREVADIGEARAGHLRIGAASSPVVKRLLVSASAALLKGAPRVTMVIKTGQPDATLAALRDGQLDLVIRSLPAQLDEDLVQEPLVYDDVVVIASATHPLTRKKKVTIQDLAAQRWALSPADTIVRRRFNQLLDAHGIIPPAPAVEIASATLKLRLVAESDLVSFQSIWWIEHQPPVLGLVKIPVRGMTSHRRAGVIYRRSAYLSPVARRFLETLRTTAKEMTAGKRSA